MITEKKDLLDNINTGITLVSKALIVKGASNFVKTIPYLLKASGFAVNIYNFKLYLLPEHADKIRVIKQLNLK